MKIGILTSSRADYSIYLPLLKALQKDSFFSLKIIAFGTHLSKKFGYTITQIKQDGFEIDFEKETIPIGFEPKDISIAISKTVNYFSSYWQDSNYDLVFALGDRYEMFAACTASVPFSIPIAHIHGGEQTLGAIDDVFRQCISLIAKVHFPVTEKYKERLIQLLNNDKNIYNVGSLSYDTLSQTKLFTTQEFFDIFKIDLNTPSILITYHPETVNYLQNKENISAFLFALLELSKYQLIITMPNADTMGDVIREKINDFAIGKNNVKLIENFGTIGYLTCMKYCRFLLGNSSSGFAEAAYFPKIVINVGDRQKGRLLTENIINTVTTKDEILGAIAKAEKVKLPIKIDAYGNGNAAKQIINILKNELATINN